VTCSLLSDKHIQVPLNQKIEFKIVLDEIILKEDVDTYVPIIDNEIYIGALLYKEKLINQNTKLQVKDPEIADICLDKYKTFLFLSEYNILTPYCYLTDEQLNTEENLVIKPRRGYASQFERLKDGKDVSEYNKETYLIQQECDKPEVTVDVCYDRNKNFFSYVCRERIEIKSGVCTKARLFYDNKIGDLAFRIADKLQLCSFCFQLMSYKKEWVLTDLNARLGAGTPMSVATGLDFFSAMFAILWQDDPSIYFRPLKKETFVTRQYADFLMNP
jgi:carbamoylphosphate synthase large subunit